MVTVKSRILMLFSSLCVALMLSTALQAQGQRSQTVRPRSAVGITPKFQIDGDRVTMHVANGVSSKVRIALSEDGADWWRAIQVVDKNGRKMMIERQDGIASTTNVLQLDRSRFDSEIRIEFWKAKLLGVHTYITSETFRVNDFVGKTVTFTWYEGIPKNDDGNPRPVNSAPINETLKIDAAKEVTVKTTDNLKHGKLDLGTIKIRMNTESGVTWWRGIKVFDSRGNAMLIEKQDGKYLTSDALEVNRGRLGRTVKIELWKAKFLGAHTHMRTLTYDAERLNGRTLTITWNKE
jgi:hypothetical protein